MSLPESAAFNQTGFWMVLHMVGALLLGWLVGYERYFSGRAAGSQVYCLVCTTSCAVSIVAGYPSLWYWGTSRDLGGGDPTHVIGSILTGIGFLGAGIIVKSGVSVRGLTTAASIWGSAAIGILMGVGFYAAALGLTVLFMVSMSTIPKIERRLPARAAMAATLRFRTGYTPRTEDIHRFLVARGLSLAPDSVTISYQDGIFQLECLIVANSSASRTAQSRIADELPNLHEIDSFTVSHSSRN